MSQRMIQFLLILLTVGCVVAFLFYFNPHAVTLHYGPGKIWEAPLALVLLLVFFFGAVTTGFLAMILGLRHTFDIWRREKKEKVDKAHHGQMIRGREQLASKNLDGAKASFQKIITRDPENIVGRILLGKTLRAQGNLRGAVRVLDEARASQKQNQELLILAASINEQRGNFTAAYDNLSLLLQADADSVFALRKIVDYSKKLDRFDDAIEFQKRLVKLTPAQEQRKEQDILASLELQYAEKFFVENRNALKITVEEILKRHRDFPEALSLLATLERESKRFEVAGKLLTKAFSITQDLQYLQDLGSMWIAQEQPSKALASVRTALGNVYEGDVCDKLPGTFFLIALLLQLEMVDDASKEFESLLAHGLLSKEGISNDLFLHGGMLKSKILERQGKVEEALRTLFHILGEKYLLQFPTLLNADAGDIHDKNLRRIGWGGAPGKHGQEGMPPPARLSTP